MSSSFPDPRDEQLLRPSEVAELFGVRTPTIARWSREGRLTPLLTPGGHRRYVRQQIQQLLAHAPDEDAAERRMMEDAVRLYEQGWSIRQVAEKFDCSYGVMRRILSKQVALRTRSGTYAAIYPEDHL